MNNSEEFYRNLCSSETIRSGKKGFFRDFSEYVMEIAGESWITQIFGKIREDRERIKILFTDAKIRDSVLETLSRVKPLFRDKDAEISRQRRLEGFRLATAGQHDKALLLFSQAVLRAPPTGKCTSIDRGFTLSLALLARAEHFMAVKEYELAMKDLELAKEEELPHALRLDLESQMKECDRCLKEKRKTLVPLKSVQKGRMTVLPEVKGGANPEIPSATKMLEIQETTIAGKQAVAREKIEPGDTIVVEPPWASCLLPEYYGTHCQHCFTRFRAPVGCPNCSGVAFCSSDCKEIALSSYHKHECKVLALLIGSGMSVLSMVALRMVTQEDPKKCQKIHAIISNETTSKGNEVRTPRANGDVQKEHLSKSAKRRLRKKRLNEFRNKGESAEERNDSPEPAEHREQDRKEEEREIKATQGEEVDVRPYDLVMHSTKRSAKDFLERSLMAAFLLKCLQRVDFFQNPSKDNEPPNEEELTVGILLLKNLQLLQFNAHEIFETRRANEHRFRGSRTVYIGVAIYPTVARFNHDCYPAVTRYFFGRHIIIKATRTLNPGEVIAENYGPIFTKRNLIDRQRTLMGRYWFSCTCTACQEDWPLFEKLTNSSVRFRCPTEGCGKLLSQPRESKKLVKCPSCQKRLNLEDRMKSLEECEELYAQGLDLMEKERGDQAIEILIEGLKKFHQIAAQPHRDTCLAEIALRTCMADSESTS